MYESFPNELLEKILERVHYKDLTQCQLVCHSWYVIARVFFYRHVVIDPRRINQFITCISRMPRPVSLPNAGSIVQKVTLKHKPRHFLYTHDFTNTNVSQLVNACPHLEAIDCVNCEHAQVIMDGLLFTDVVVQLKQLPNIASELEQYKNCAYRFRSSLTTLTLPSHHQRLDLDFLTGFPMLSQLDLGKNEVTSIGYLDALLNACPTLQELTFPFNIIQIDDINEENMMNANDVNNITSASPSSLSTSSSSSSSSSPITANIIAMNVTNNNNNNNIEIAPTPDFTKEIYPTLKHLFITTTQDTIPQALIDYILCRFTNLKTLDIEGVDIIDTTLKMSATFESLMSRMDHMESCSLRLRGNDYNVTSQVAQSYLQGLSLTVQEPRVTSIKIHNNPRQNVAFFSYWTGSFGIQRRRHFQIRLPDFETANQELQSQYIQQFSRFVNELSIDYQGTIFYKYALTQLYDLILQHCLKLRTLKFNYAELDVSDKNHSPQNHAIQRLHLVKSHIPQACFKQLSFQLPNLQHLILSNNFHMDDPRCIRIDMRYSQLESMALLGESYFPWISTLSQNNHPIEEVILLVARQDGMTKYYYASVLSIYPVEADEEFAESVISRRRAMSIYISTKSIKSIILGTANTNTQIYI